MRALQGPHSSFVKCLATIVVIFSIAPSDVAAMPDDPGSQAQLLGVLAGSLNEQVTIKGPWSVVQGYVVAQLEERDARHGALKLLLDGHSFADLTTPSQIADFIKILRKQGSSFSTTTLVEGGLPPQIAQAVSDRMRRRYLFQLQQALLTYSQAPGISAKGFGAAVNGALRQSTTPLLVRQNMGASEFQAIAEQIRAHTQNAKRTSRRNAALLNVSQNRSAQMAVGVDDAFLDITNQPNLSELKNEMFKYLNEPATQGYELLKSAKEKEAFLDSLAEDFVARASSVVVPVSSRKLSVNDGIQVLTRVGQFQALERTAAVQITQGAATVGAGLEAARKLIEENWRTVVVAAGQITGSLTSLPVAALNVANTSHIINDLANFTSGGQLSGSTVTELASLVTERVPASKDVLNLATGIKQLAEGQTSFVQQGQFLIGELANITGSPMLGQVKSAFSSFAPVLQAAGPLLAMAGFASPLGGISMIGGLLGGGGGLLGGSGGGADSAMLQAISQKLEVMDHKLDLIIQDLDALNRKIDEQHIEVMNALESISFDINRTLDIIRSADVKAFSRECEDIPEIVADKSLPSSTVESQFTSCYGRLKSLSLRLNSPESFFKAIPNLTTENLHSTAFQKLQDIAKVYSKTESVAANSCFSLALAAYSVHDVDRNGEVGQKQAHTDREADLCEQVLSFSNMIHSGTIVFFSSLELSAADHSDNLDQSRAISLVWNTASRPLMVHRWKNELRMLNVAIGQQARLTGDFTAPSWASKFELTKPFDKTEQEVLDQSEILAQNSLRFWLREHLRKGEENEPHSKGRSSRITSRSLRYATAYYGCSPDYLQSLTFTGPIGNVDFSKVHFNWTSTVLDRTTDAESVQPSDAHKLPQPCPSRPEESHRWCVLFDGLNNCINLPTPEESITGELRRSDNLEALLDTRERMLELIETTQLIEKLDSQTRLRLIEALAMKWAVDQRQQEKGAVEQAQESAELRSVTTNRGN